MMRLALPKTPQARNFYLESLPKRNNANGNSPVSTPPFFQGASCYLAGQRITQLILIKLSQKDNLGR